MSILKNIDCILAELSAYATAYFLVSTLAAEIITAGRPEIEYVTACLYAAVSFLIIHVLYLVIIKLGDFLSAYRIKIEKK